VVAEKGGRFGQLGVGESVSVGGRCHGAGAGRGGAQPVGGEDIAEQSARSGDRPGESASGPVSRPGSIAVRAPPKAVPST
jgi:hypothetical protein